mmetsp:Transcript_31208/g.70219  ORF Transcript_31208/g.70219 Transcript_31208/m.70219 type:complete len:204 (+) Transcript_31208:551-1162(+)
MKGGPFSPHKPPKNPQSIPIGTNTGISHLGGTRDKSGTFFTSSTSPGLESSTSRHRPELSVPLGAHAGCWQADPRCGTDGESVASRQCGPAHTAVSERGNTGSALGWDTGGSEFDLETACCGASGTLGSPRREELRLFTRYCRTCTKPLVQIFSSANTRNRAASPNRTSSAGTFSRTKFPSGEVLVILTLKSNPGLQYSLQSL